MQLRTLKLDHFGPFKHYSVPLSGTEDICILLTGRNNEGKSNIIMALRLLYWASKVINQNRQRVTIDGSVYFKLLQQDVGGIRVGRMVHNYENTVATITGDFEGFSITVYLNPLEELVYARSRGPVPGNLGELFGFMPPLGPIADREDLLTANHVMNSVETTLAPRHLRNHLYHARSKNEFGLIQQIIADSWEGVQLLDVEHDIATNQLNCFYKEGQFEREIAWAGQGLQVWIQIVTHMVRLRGTSVLVLDEPEVNLHPEKQHDLVRLLREHHSGSVIVATHSVELMNDVNVSHIFHVQKATPAPRLKTTSDRAYLELVRSRIGSNFNLVASQFDAVDVVLFTEDRSDFSLVREMAESLGLAVRMFNIPIHGFSEYRKALYYRDAYETLIGTGKAKYTLLLDRDYYPDEHLNMIQTELGAAGIRVVFTPGKEIENLFLQPGLLESLFGASRLPAFKKWWENLFEEEHLESYGSCLKLHGEFTPGRPDSKTITRKVTPGFNSRWRDPDRRHNLIGGKRALKRLRSYYQRVVGSSLTQRTLITALVRTERGVVESFLETVLHLDSKPQKT